MPHAALLRNLVNVAVLRAGSSSSSSSSSGGAEGGGGSGDAQGVLPMPPPKDPMNVATTVMSKPDGMDMIQVGQGHSMPCAVCVCVCVRVVLPPRLQQACFR